MQRDGTCLPLRLAASIETQLIWVRVCLVQHGKRAHPRRMRENLEISSLVVTVMVPPTTTVRDVAVSVGLVARLPSELSRYGGV